MNRFMVSLSGHCLCAQLTSGILNGRRINVPNPTANTVARTYVIQSSFQKTRSIVTRDNHTNDSLKRQFCLISNNVSMYAPSISFVADRKTDTSSLIYTHFLEMKRSGWSRLYLRHEGIAISQIIYI